MKIVAMSNFDDDTVSDELLLDHVPEDLAYKLERLLNVRFGGAFSHYFYKAMPEAYRLKEWGP